VAETLKTILKQAVESIEEHRRTQILRINELAYEATVALQKLIELIEADPARTGAEKPTFINLDGTDPLQKEQIKRTCTRAGCNCMDENTAKRHFCPNPTPKQCDSDYHPPECDSEGLRCEQIQLRCRTCYCFIDYGNCCTERCTKAWVAAHEFHGNPRLCRRCGTPHELKSNYCGPCNKGVQHG
jgi:hypothetical protein